MKKQKQCSKCDLCNRRMFEKEKNLGCVCLTSHWELFFCRKCYPKILKVIKDTARKYKEFYKKRSDKDFERSLFFWYKLQEWAYLEYILKTKLETNFF